MIFPDGIKVYGDTSLRNKKCPVEDAELVTFINQIKKAERQRLLRLLQHLSFTITKTRPVAEAIVTAGGVSIKEINPSTMESKLVSRLYIVGELLDVDGYTGGYNLQAAFSTGYVAGKAAAKE